MWHRGGRVFHGPGSTLDARQGRGLTPAACKHCRTQKLRSHLNESSKAGILLGRSPKLRHLFPGALEFLCSWQPSGAPPPPHFRYLPASVPPAAASVGDPAWAVRSLANPGLPPPYTPQGHLRALAEGEGPVPPAVLERGPQRVVRAGVQTGLEVFWLGASIGWGLRTLEGLEPGQFICEYAGEVLPDAEAEERCLRPPGRDAYLFDLPTPSRCRLFGAMLPAEWCAGELEEDHPVFVVDAFASGNVGRFLNHACGPSFAANVTPVFVYVEAAAGILPDARLPRVALFANRRVAAGEELRYDYDMEPGEVASSDGGGRSLACHCGSAVCRGRVY
uniref:Histone-lysine N-methyltransferase n=1 Tax=Alexandrium monilatum TaxID=311494 RepID=A0A7S4R1C2_9DINO